MAKFLTPALQQPSPCQAEGVTTRVTRPTRAAATMVSSATTVAYPDIRRRTAKLKRASPFKRSPKKRIEAASYFLGA